MNNVEDKLVILVGTHDKSTRCAEIEELVGVRGWTMTLIPWETEVFGISVPLRQYTEKESVYLWVCSMFVIAMVSLYVGICIGSKGFTGSWMHMIPLFLLCGWHSLVESRLYCKSIKYNNTSGVSWVINGTLILIFFVWLVYGPWQKTDSVFYLFSTLGLVLFANKKDVAKIMSELVPPYQWQYTGIEVLEELRNRAENAKYEKIGVYVEHDYWTKTVRKEVLTKYPNLGVVYCIDYYREVDSILTCALSDVGLIGLAEKHRKLLTSWWEGALNDFRREICKLVQEEDREQCKVLVVFLQMYMRSLIMLELERYDKQVLQDYRSLYMVFLNTYKSWLDSVAEVVVSTEPVKVSTKLVKLPTNLVKLPTNLVKPVVIDKCKQVCTAQKDKYVRENCNTWILKWLDESYTMLNIREQDKGKKETIKWCVDTYFAKIHESLYQELSLFDADVYVKYIVLLLFSYPVRERTRVDSKIVQICDFLNDTTLTQRQKERKEEILKRLPTEISNVLEYRTDTEIYRKVFKRYSCFKEVCFCLKQRELCIEELIPSEIRM